MDAATAAKIREHYLRLTSDKGRTRVRRGRPCPICDHTDWCLADEQAALCPRSNGTGAAYHYQRYGYLHLLESDITPQWAPKRTSRPQQTDEQLDRRWAPAASRLCDSAGTHLDRLACKLGVARWALRALRVGYGMLGGQECWSFPERSATGLVVGINRRFENGEKRTAKGGRRGLIYAENWAEYDGPVLLVEGGSDTASLLSLHLCVIGRPSNTGGVVQIHQLLRLAKIRDRQVIVLGELDRRRHEALNPKMRAMHDPHCRGCVMCWPGKYGAISTAKELTERLNRKVWWMFPPAGAKDVRSWLNRQPVDVNDDAAAQAVGQRLLAMLTPPKRPPKKKRRANA